MGGRGHLFEGEDAAVERVYRYGKEHGSKEGWYRSVCHKWLSSNTAAEIVIRLQVVSSEYLVYLNTKVKSAALQGTNEIPHSEALGEVFVSFGEELDADSSLGATLVFL